MEKPIAAAIEVTVPIPIVDRRVDVLGKFEERVRAAVREELKAHQERVGENAGHEGHA